MSLNACKKQKVVNAATSTSESTLIMHSNTPSSCITPELNDSILDCYNSSFVGVKTSIRNTILPQNSKNCCVLEDISPLEKFLCYYQLEDSDNHQQWFKMIVKDPNEFKFDLEHYSEVLERVLAIDLQSLGKIHLPAHSLVYQLPHYLSNLRTLNISNTDVHHGLLVGISENCPHLEKVTWNNQANSVYLNGGFLKNASNVKELYMDNAIFPNLYQEKEKMSNLDNPKYSNDFIFQHCHKTLQSVSIRNLKFQCHNRHKICNTTTVVVPQNALIKFVLNAPKSLRWFRSDLTEANIVMLRRIRPGIAFVN
jgi:hypothetical protein